MASDTASDQFSAEVRLGLVIRDRRIPIAQVGPGFAMLREPIEIQPGEKAVLIMTVDGREHKWKITLKNGAVPFDRKVEYVINRYPRHACLFDLS
jgi:hypothetical protein